MGNQSLPLIRLNQILSLQAPGSEIRLFSDGAYDCEKNTPLIDKFVTNPMQTQHQYGIGKTAIYIEGILANGVKNRIALS